MPAITDPTLLGSLTLAFTLGAGTVAANARRAVHRAREHEMMEAVALLKLHCECMEKLDDEAMPESLLSLAIDISSILHDPKLSKRVRDVLAAGYEQPKAEPSEEADLKTSEFQTLLAHRSDLAIAFMQAVVSALLAFEKRWPECAGKILPSISGIVAAPMTEAERIVRAAGSVRDWTVPPVGAVPA